MCMYKIIIDLFRNSQKSFHESQNTINNNNNFRAKVTRVMTNILMLATCLGFARVRYEIYNIALVSLKCAVMYMIYKYK